MKRILSWWAFGLTMAACASPAGAQQTLDLSVDMVLDSRALHLPSDAAYDRAINGLAFQDAPLLTRNGHQYAVWYGYDGSPNEHAYIARRNLNSNTWQPFDTGRDLVNGDNTWDAHNVISLGISGDGRLHVGYDMHGNNLKYFKSDPGVALFPDTTPWNNSLFNADQNWLVSPDQIVTRVTYPEFSLASDGDLAMTYRFEGSGDGDVRLTTYEVDTGTWSTPRPILSRVGSYSDRLGSSKKRNPYINALDYGPDGRMHVTWTWREGPTDSNHDILYAYSEDRGDTWKNNAGTVVGTIASPITVSSPGTIIAAMDRTHSLINQQGQVVDLDGRVHVLAFHRRDEPEFAWQPGDPKYVTQDSAHFHYFRDPNSGQWTRGRLPVMREVGSRPSIGYDKDGNVFAAYISPGPENTGGYQTEGDLVIAKATKAAAYTDWTIVFTDPRDFIGEPFIDQDRLVGNDVLSIFVQEFSLANGVSGSPLHVLEFDIEARGHAGAGVLQFGSASYSVSEADSTATVTLMRTDGSSGAASVQIVTSDGSATDGSDYGAVTQIVLWADGEGGTRSVSVPITNDDADEADETIILSLSGVTGASAGAPSTAVLTIADDDGELGDAGVLQFGSASYAVSEADSTATITLTRTGGSSGAASVQIATSDGSATAGSDYGVVTEVVLWADGDDGTKSVSVPIIDDETDEPDETVLLTLLDATGASLGSPATATLNIGNDERPLPTVSFSDDRRKVSEFVGTATVRVNLSAASDREITVPLSFGGTASRGADYTVSSTSLAIPAGATGADLQFTVINDNIQEVLETAVVTMGTPTHAEKASPATYTLRIGANDE